MVLGLDEAASGGALTRDVDCRLAAVTISSRPNNTQMSGCLLTVDEVTL